MRIILLISMTALLSLSGIIFAIAEGSPLAGFSLLLAMGTLFFVDLEEKVSVPPTIANLLGLMAFLIAGLEFFNGRIESRILSGGHLIVYLTWVFMIQHKEVRHFWWLSALSLLQIATASVLTTHIWFGWALILYCFLATWTLAVFLLYRSTVTGIQFNQNADQQARFVVGDSWKGVSRDVDHRILNWRFLGITSTMTFLGLLLSLLFFLFTPRIWIGQFDFLSDEASSGRALTGFTEEVRLGDMGEILENDDLVLELKLLHTATEIPFTEKETQQYLGAEPLFRGAVMERYENGRWRQQGGSHYQRFPNMSRNRDITQLYKLYSIGSPILFSYGDLTSARSFNDDRRVYRQQFSDELERDPEAPLEDVFEYVVQATAAPFDTSFAEQRSFWSRFYQLEFYTVYQRPLREVPNQLTRVRDFARSLVDLQSSDEIKAARLEQFFLQSNEFTYSLDLSIEDASIDPIEDFMFNRKSGHCEYYASSLAIMLRSVGIPARMVSGFKGGQYDPESQKHLVKQFHAHSWVEAFIDGHWKTFDPTPATRQLSVSEQEQAVSSYSIFMKKMNGYWSTGVGMSKRQQQELIYQPIQDLGEETWETAKNLVQGRSSSLKGMVDFLKSPDQWFSLKGGLFAFVLLLLISGFVWLTKQLGGLFQKMQSQKRKTLRQFPEVEFYGRFLKILKRQGLNQQPTQTAREFVTDSLAKLQPLLHKAELDDWPQDLVAKFYNVRFGGHPLAETDSTEINRRLTALENCLANREKSAT